MQTNTPKKFNDQPITGSPSLRWVRLALIVISAGTLLSIVLNLVRSGSFGGLLSQVETLFFALVILVCTFGFDVLRDRYLVVLPERFVLMVTAFIIGSWLFGENFGFYERFWWWDDVLHLMSGLILAIIGLFVVYYLQARYNAALHPLLVALFTFTFAVTLGVVWEVFEFAVDALLGGNMQRWNAPADVVLLGREYQGAAVRDTMSDLIIDSIGAAIVSAVVYRAHTGNRHRIRAAARRIFPGLFGEDA
jgi:hypothetical protein